METPLSSPLLTTKIIPPPPGTHNLVRRRLLAELDSGWSANKRLILVCAPAGYGKSTLVVDWLHQIESDPPDKLSPQSRRYSWLSLEAADNDPLRFFLYLVAGLQRTLPSVGLEAYEYLLNSHPQASQRALTSLLNDLALIEGAFALVLDDYQVIQSPIIQSSVETLLEHLPPQVHMVITTRSDPALPLHRYRARGQMVEIRMDDLRFTTEEAGQFVNTLSDKNLGSKDIQILTQRTEGWIAGIQMAVLSLRSKPDAADFIQRFAGSNRFILDYLAEEVLKDQPAEVRHFLLETSILTRLCADLCDAVTRQRFILPGSSYSSSQELLNYLDRSNLFLIPLDEERKWFRYHPLFADLLQIWLNQTQDEPPAVELHRRAAAWYESKGWVSEAISHAIQGQAFSTAASLVENHTVELFAQGRLQQLLSWIHSLPVELTQQRPWLAIYQAWILAFAARFHESTPLLEQVRSLMSEANLPENERRALQGELYAIERFTAFLSNDPRQQELLKDLSLEAVPPERIFARSVVRWVQGYRLRMQDNLPAAVAAFEQVYAMGKQINNVWTILTAAVDLGMVLRLSGRLLEAETIFYQAIGIVQDSGPASLGFLGRLEAFLANCLYERNDLSAARQLINQSIEHNRLWENPNHSAFAYLSSARIHIAAGEFTQAGADLSAAGEISSAQPVVGSITAGIRAQKVRLVLAEKRLSEYSLLLERIISERGDSPQPGEIAGIDALSEARLRNSLGERSNALHLLNELEKTCRLRDKKNLLIETLVCKALVQGSAGADALAEALMIGLPAGYRRVFLDEGPEMQNLLRSLLEKPVREHNPFNLAANRSLQAGLSEVLAAFPIIPTSPRASNLLTSREMDILRELAGGYTNQEISRRLFISLGTVKAHTAAIYRKLDAENRAEAVARAKDLGILNPGQ